MEVKAVFKENEDITIEEYLKKCGVENVEKYLKINTIDNSEDYISINKAKIILDDFVNS